jgi:hypothetical protein
VLDHATDAAHHDSSSSNHMAVFLVRDFPLPEWLALAAALFEPVARAAGPVPGTPLVHVLAAGNYARLLRAVRRRRRVDPGGGGVHVEGGVHRYALFAALREGHRAAAAAILLQEEGEEDTVSVAGMREEDIMARLPCGSDLKVEKSQTWAIQGGHEALARLLISPSSCIWIRRMIWGSRRCRMQPVKGRMKWFGCLLIQKGVRIDRKDELGRTALFWAVQFGRESIATQLLKRGAYVEAKENVNGQTPLSKAAELGHAGIVQRLLEHGAYIEARDS